VFVSLQALELKPVIFKIDLPAGEIDFEAKLKQSSALHVEGKAELLNESLGEIRVTGDLSVQIENVCDRCAEPATCLIANHFDLIYMPAKEANASTEDEIDQGAIEVGYYDGNGLELNDVLREVVLLALPMQLLCREDCKGVCPSCGENLNLTACGCQPEMADDRWSKLKMLRAEIGLQN
jgi:DUF177 domain-containing protein